MVLISIVKRAYEAGLALVGFRRSEPDEPVRHCKFGHSAYLATNLCSYGHHIAR